MKRPRRGVCPKKRRRQLRVFEEVLPRSVGSLLHRHQIQLNSISESLYQKRKNKIIQKDFDTVAWLSN